MKSSEWYKIGDIVTVKDKYAMEDDSDLEPEFRRWVTEFGEEELVIHRIQEETERDRNGFDIAKPMYYVYLKGDDSMSSPEGFYHLELTLLRAKQTDWDE